MARTWPCRAFALALLVGLPLLNAHVGIPYVSQRLPEDEAAWIVHRVVLIAAHVALLLIGLGMRNIRGDALRHLRGHLRLALGFVALCLLAAAVAVLRQPIEPLPAFADLGSFSRTAQLLSVTSILWAGVGQELLFRGMALPIVAAETGSRGVAVVVTSASFAYYHGGFSLGIWSLLGNFAAGLALAVLYLRTGGLWVVVGLHVAFLTAALALA